MLDGDSFFREKEGKKERTIRNSLGKMFQIAYAYIHTLIRMPAHISTAYTDTATHIPSAHLSAPVNPFTAFLLDFPRPLLFPSICPFLHLIRVLLNHTCTLSNTLYKTWWVSRNILFQGFKEGFKLNKKAPIPPIIKEIYPCNGYKRISKGDKGMNG